MTTSQILILLLAVIPLSQAFLLKSFTNIAAISNLLTKICPILFLVNIIGLYGSLGYDVSSLNLITINSNLAFAFNIDNFGLFFLFLLSLLWLIFAFYLQYYFKNDLSNNINSFKIFTSLMLAAIILIIISANLLTILFFYNCLNILCHFFALLFLHKKIGKFSRLLSILLYVESAIFFIAIVATYKFSGQINFNSEGIISDITATKQRILLILFLFGLFFSVIFPCYLLYRNLNLNPLILYVFFFLSYAFISLYILAKILGNIFGFNILQSLLGNIGFSFFESIFLFNIAVISIFLMFNNGLKSSFFYLIFHQFSFALFSIILFSVFAPDKIYIAITSFVLSLTLAFITIANSSLYLTNSALKSTKSLFFNLKITISLLIFAIATMAGVAPGIGIFEKFFIVKIIIKEKLYLSALIILVNLLALVAFMAKSFYPFFIKSDLTNIDEQDLKLAQDIEYDSSSILTTVILALAIFLAPILFLLF